MGSKLLGFVALLVVSLGLLAAIAAGPPARDTAGSIRHTDYPQVIVVGDPTLIPVAGTFWETEIARRFPHSVVLLAHGNDLSGVFFTFPDGTIHSGVTVEDEMTQLQAEYPGRAVIILSCNPEHVAIHGHPGCFYSTSETWIIPDRAVGLPGTEGFDSMKLDDAETNRYLSSPDTVGDAFEFQEAI